MRIDKVARAYLAMRAPQRYPAIETSFGEHSQRKEELSEAIFVDPRYSEFDKYKRNPEEAERLHESHSDMQFGPHIDAYTKNSLPMNSALHKHYGGTYVKELGDNPWNTKSEDTLSKAHELDKQLQGHTAKEDFHVFTGMLYSPFKHAIDEQGNHMVHLPAFTSTSTNFHKALFFTDTDHKTQHDALKHNGVVQTGARHMLKLNIPKGTQIASIKHLSSSKAEDEFLMNRGYDLAINPHPIQASGESNVPVYIWSATPVKRRPKPIQS